MAKLNQVAPQEDKETHITVDYFNDVVKLYTNAAKVMRRLEKKGVPYTKQTLHDEEVFGRCYELPLKDMKIFLSTTLVK